MQVVLYASCCSVIHIFFFAIFAIVQFVMCIAFFLFLRF